MKLEPGSKLASYEILALLGKGGMGEVWRGRDTRLDRDVAVKALPELFDADSERRLRFEREAKILASLNHPNIAAIHGLEEVDGQRFLVLEYVPGETLAERIDDGPLGIEATLQIARQIAEALESAHQSGVVHRDLKPGNVMVQPDDTVKVLDFGLARADADASDSSAAEDSPTITENYTTPGVVLGTAPYMSPEQARGRRIDKRSDIWSFGVILYECLTGAKLFGGDTATDSIGAILHKPLTWSDLPAATPPTVQRLLRRCLTRERKRRLQDIGDARVDLEDAIADPSGSNLGLAAAALDATRLRDGARAKTVPWLVAGVLLVLTVLGFWRPWAEPIGDGGRATGGAAYRFSIAAEQSFSRPMISPDGTKLLYISQARLWLRHLDQLEARALPGTEGVICPFWSPDNQTVGYVKDEGGRSVVWRHELHTDRASAFLETNHRMMSWGTIAWQSDGRIFISTGAPEDALLEAPDARGGVARPVLKPLGTTLYGASALPDGRGVLFVEPPGPGGTMHAFDGTERKLIYEGSEGETFFYPQYDPGTQHVVYGRVLTTAGSRREEVWAFAFDLASLSRAGEPFPIASDAGLSSISHEGTLVYWRAGSRRRPETQLVLLDRTGKLVPESIIGETQAGLRSPRVSPDGTHVLAESFDRDVPSLWLHEIGSPITRRVTSSGNGERAPGWWPGGQKILFVRDAKIYSRSLLDGGEETEWAEGWTWSLSPNGKVLAFTRWVEGNPSIYWLDTTANAAEPVPFLATNASETNPALSPNGKHLAYVSDETGEAEVYVVSFPDRKSSLRVSFDGGRFPLWNRNGNELFYQHQDGEDRAMIGALLEITESSIKRKGEPTELFRFRASQYPYEGFDVTKDGKFVAAKINEPADASEGVDDDRIIVDRAWINAIRQKR